MSDRSRFSTEFDGDSFRTRLSSLLFGDRVGLALFLATLCLVTVFWITAWRINDSLTLMNTLHAMSEGQLHITEVTFGASAGTPGTHQVGERIYGRNYGVLTVSLVPLLVLDAVAYVADLRIALAGIFSFGVLALGLVVGRIVDRRPRFGTASAIVAIAVFAGNVYFATTLEESSVELYALQVTHMVAAAFVVVFAYRLLAELHGRRAGLLGGALVALATPIGLWASVPKRHVVTAALTLVLAFALYRSRVKERAVPGSGRRYRAGAYAAIALFAWVHAPEAFVILVVFAVVDLPTAKNDLRSLATIAVPAVVAGMPFLVTNYLISGSPAMPPRMLPDVGGATGEPSFSGGSGDAGGASGAGGGGDGGGILAPLLGVLDPLLAPVMILTSIFVESLRNVVFEPDQILTIFTRSGYLGGWPGEQANYESVNLAILESAPILAGVLGVVPVTVSKIRRRTGRRFGWPPAPERAVDVFLVLSTVAFSLLYLSRLPLQAQITVRYMLPIFPALVVLIVRLPAIRGVLDSHWRLLLWTYAVAVFVGGQLLVAVLAVMNPALGEAFQFHALIGLAIAVPLAAWSLTGRDEGWWGRAGAVLIALATAAITIFLLLLALAYFTVGNSQALPIVRAVADVVSIT